MWMLPLILKPTSLYYFEHRDEYFGNARTVRQIVAESVKNQHLRLSTMKKEDRTPEIITTVILDDVKEFDGKDVKAGKAKIGFKSGKS